MICTERKSNMRNSISQETFVSIVDEALKDDPDVQEYTITDKGVSVSIRASMRRENVNAFLDFDDRGEITGRFSHAQTDANAQKPREISIRISEMIRNSL